MRTIALYNRAGQRLLPLKEAHAKGYGSIISLKQRIHRHQIPGYKIGPVWLVRQQDLRRPTHRRSTARRRSP